VRERHADEWKQHFQAVRQTQRELRHMVVTGADPSAYQAKLAELQTLMNQGLEMRVNTLKEISPILTPEQREKFADAVDQSFHHGGGRRGPRSGQS
jgi:Spy/CpxP family protein refolding chaperone